jgi:hypothetical protein
MRKPMVVTPERLEANRRNAQKSTGPKTVNGKVASKLNALKHGLLAKTVVVHGHKLKESTNEFKKLCHAFYLDFAPVGPMEETLVDQIVQAAWRLRRVRAAESGEIALSVDTGWWNREKNNPLRMILNMPQMPFSDPLVTQLKNSVWGCKYLRHCLNSVHQSVEQNQELTEVALKDFKTALRDQPDAMVKKMDELRAWFVTNPEKLEQEALRTRHKEEVLKFLNRKISDIDYWMDRREQRENAEEQARQSAAMLPSAETLDKILRYETALERQLFRAMNQLERLQRRRMGEKVPAPLTMEITTRV